MVSTCRPRVRWMSVLMLVMAASGAARADTVALKANLQPSSEVPPRVSKGHGIVDANFDTDTKVLTWTVTYADLSGPVTMAHFHGPAPVGQNAKPQVSIDAKTDTKADKKALASPMKGQATLSDQQVNDLMTGQWYFNIHTQDNPSGEIRGQITPAN